MGRQAVWIGASGLAAVTLAVWLGASMVAGQRAEAALQALKNAPVASSGLHLTRLQHERGLFSAQGEAEVSYVPGCAAEAGADAPVTLKVSYTMSHLIMPTALTRFTWTASPMGATADEFKALFGSVTALSGAGAVALNGALRTDLALPALSLQRAGEAFQLDPSTGFLSVHDKALAFAWKADRLVTRGGGEAMEVKGLAIDMDLRNRDLGTGTTRVAAQHISLGVGTLDGVSVVAEASEKGDRLDMRVTPAIKRLVGNGVDLSDLTLDLALQGMDTRSVETLSQLFQASCGMQSLTAAEGKAARDAALTLLTRGFSLGVPKLAGKGADGVIDGKLMVELLPAKDGKPSLAAQFRSSGQLDVSGKIVPVDRRDMAVNLGFAVAQGEGLRAGFEYADGLLKVNGRALDASSLLVGLKAADAQLQAVLALWERGEGTALARHEPLPELTPAEPEPPVDVAPAAPVAAPAAEPPPAPVAAIAPAPAPVTAPAAPATAVSCTVLPACVQQTLAAARLDDVESVRHLAAGMDALPKPAPGNRPVSRQLNTAGLDALKRDDFGDAVSKLRQAVQENPRDVEIAGNLGFALIKAGQAREAVEVLQAALVLEPRRTSTWTPLAEALALSGRADDAKAALWVSFQWSANRDKSLAYYEDRVARDTREPVQALYRHMARKAQLQLASAR